MGEGRQYCPVLMRCPACGREEYRRPVFVPVAQPLYKGHEEMLPEYCEGEHTMASAGGRAWHLSLSPMEVVPGFNHDLTLTDFDVDMETLTDGRVQGKQRISSLHEIRQIENESLRRHANGEGQPMIFRDFSQNKSNRSVHTLTGTPYEKHRSAPRDEVFKRAKTHAGPITVKRVSADEVGA